MHARTRRCNAIQARIRRRESELEELRAQNPKPVVWKKIQLGDYGAGRNVRMGDLDGDGQTDFLIGQNMMRFPTTTRS